ncbi:MAG: hypothetical protein VKJ02_10190 [Snowella sp.]|nr:hypothetical protein [Snowella sp.]
MNQAEIPVVITHFIGKPTYLKFALKSAADFNKTVVLIGSDSNQDFWEHHWNTTLIECEKYQEFKKWYVKMCTYDEKYDDVCWKRLFMLEEWMKRNNATQAFFLDSDIMTFANYSSVLAPVLSGNYTTFLNEPQNQSNFRWSSCSHFAYWTLEAIEDFTSFCIEAYRSNKDLRTQLDAKWQWHIDNQQPGGICDMTLLYFWSKNNPRVANFTKVINDMTVEHCINVSENYLDDEYQMQLGVKKIIFKNGIPYGFNKDLKKEIRFLCIHCQGTAKILMRFFYYKNLRSFYLIAKVLEILKRKTKFFIEGIKKGGQSVQ